MSLKTKYLVLLTITNLAFTTGLNVTINVVKNKILVLLTYLLLLFLLLLKKNLGNLVKSDYNKKRSEIENIVTTDHEHVRYITTQEFNKSTAENFTARLVQANSSDKTDIANFLKKTYLDKNELSEISKELQQYQHKDK